MKAFTTLCVAGFALLPPDEAIETAPLRPADLRRIALRRLGRAGDAPA